MIALKSIDKRSLINFDDLLFMLIEKGEEVDLNQLYYVDAVIINSIEPEFFEKYLSGIRQHYNPNIYLKPIYGVQHKETPERYLQCCDETTDMVHYDYIARRTREINQRAEKLFQIQKFPTPETEFIFKTLQFVYTRETPLQPIPHRVARIHYHFPFISQQIKDDEAQKILSMLTKAVDQGYLSAEIRDKVHLCPNCGSAHHTIRESCKKCGGIDLEIEDLIHHFQCAYVGPESDFRADEHSDMLACPKCHKSVRHIGIDYDKPSQIYNCNTCSHHFQESSFTFKCMDCSEVKEIRHLIEHTINSLSITSKGTNLVLKGLPKANTNARMAMDNNEVLGIYSYPVFQQLVRQERSRTSQNGRNSILLTIQLPEDQINRLSEHDVLMMQTELCQELKNYLRDTDMVSTKNPALYFALLTDSGIKRAQELKDTITYNFTELIRGNFDEIEVITEVNMEVMNGMEVNLPDQDMN